MRRLMVWLLPLTVLLLMVGCASTTVERMDTAEVKDLSGRWNDSDSQMVSEAMIQDCLNHPWLSDFTARAGKKPDVIVGSIRNRSSEHIATEVFVKDLERALINLGLLSGEPSPAHCRGCCNVRAGWRGRSLLWRTAGAAPF